MTYHAFIQKTTHAFNDRKPKLPIDMEYAMSSNDESDGDVHTGDGDGARNDESDGDVHTGDGDGARNDESDGDGDGAHTMVLA